MRLLVLTGCDAREPLGVAALAAEAGAAEVAMEIAKSPSPEERVLVERHFGLSWIEVARTEPEATRPSESVTPAEPPPALRPLSALPVLPVLSESEGSESEGSGSEGNEVEGSELEGASAEIAAKPIALSLAPAEQWSELEISQFEPEFQSTVPLAKSTEFGKAAEAIQAFLPRVPAGRYKGFLEERARHLAELGEFKKTLTAVIHAPNGASKLTLPIGKHGPGVLRDADPRNVWVEVEGAQIGIPWEKIDGRTISLLVDLLRLGPDNSALASLWVEEQGEPEAARQLLDGLPQDPVRQRIAAYLASAGRVRALRELPALREKLKRSSAEGRFAEARDEAGAILAHADALEPAEVEELKLQLQGLREKLAGLELQRAQELVDQGKHDEAARLLARALEIHKGAAVENAIRKLHEQASQYNAFPVARFDTEEEFSQWDATGFEASWNRDPAFIRSGAGSVRLSATEKEYCALSSAFVPHDWTGYDRLVAWIYSDSKSYASIWIYGATTHKDIFGHSVTLNWTGWKRVSCRIKEMSTVGNPKLEDIAEVMILHFDSQPSCVFYVDNLYLLRLGAHEPGSSEIAGRSPEDEAQAAGGKPGPPAENETVPSGPPPGTGVLARKTGIYLPLGLRYYVNREVAIALVPPSNWRPVPPPKERAERDRSKPSAVKILTSFQNPNPDETYRLSAVTMLYLGTAREPDEAREAYLKWADEHYVGGLAVVERQPLRVGPWNGTRIVADAAKGFRVVSYVLSSGADSVVLEVSGGSNFTQRRAKRFDDMARSVVFLSPHLAASLSKQNKLELPPGWQVVETSHYAIQFNCGLQFAKTVGKHLEAILKEYARRFPMEETLEGMSRTSKGDVPKFTVKVFKTETEFKSYASSNGVQGAAAYFSPAQEELVCYKTSERGLQKTFHILYHEASHQYLHLYMGPEVELPIWLNEGVAEYFYGGEFESNEQFSIKINRDRILAIKQAIREGTHVPLEKFFRYTQAQYYSNAELCYAQGWAVAYFLWHTKDPRYAGRLDRFYEVLKSKKDGEQALEEAFGDLDFDALDEDWPKFVLGL